MRRYSSPSPEGTVGGALGGCLMVFLVIGLIGSTCFNYVLNSLIGKTVPFIPAALGGFVGGVVTVPAAVICWILHLCGLHFPLFHVS